MANQGIYREPSAAAGLPLPRTRLWPLTIVTGLVALVAIGMSPILLAVIGQGGAGAWRLFRNGGWPMYLILLCDVVAPIAVAVLGAFVVRGRRVPAGVLFVCAAIPFAFTLLGAWVGQRMMINALSGDSIDPEMKVRILAEGVSETMSNDIFGGLVVCGIALAATLAATSAATSIDVATASRDGSKPSTFGALGAGACGAVWILATLIVGAIRMRNAGGVVFLSVLPLFVIVPFAAMAGRGAAIVRGWHDRAEGSRVAGALVVAALSALLAMLALQRGIEATFTSRALSAIAGESIDPSQRARILAEAVEGGRLAPASYAVHAVLGTATFGLALAPALGSGKNPATPSTIVAGGFALLALALAFSLGHSRASLARAAADSGKASIPDDVTLPVTVESLSNKRSGGAHGSRVVVTKDGGGAEASWSASTSNYAVYADKAATLGMVRARLPKGGSTPVSFVTTRELPPDIDARLGDLAGYLGRTGYVSATVEDNPSGVSYDTVRVTSVADDAVDIDGRRVAFPIADGAAGCGSGERRSRIRYVVRPADTVERAIGIIVAAEKLCAEQIRSWDLERVIVVDDGTRKPVVATDDPTGFGGLGVLGSGTAAAGANGTPTIRAGAASVNGRLPPEVIQRIVRQNFGRFRLCYENGLRTTPELRGRVTVKFVIDRSGAVTQSSDGGSDLPDKGVVACIVRSFTSLSFPQPEGGIVTVVYPLDLTRAK